MSLWSLLRRSFRVREAGRRPNERRGAEPREPAVHGSKAQAAASEMAGGATAIVPWIAGRSGADERWRGVACSVVGTSHEESGRQCDDVSVVLEVGAATLLVVSDGAGSARHARKGATVAVGASAESAATRLAAGEAPGDSEGWRSLLRECLLAARRAIDECPEPPEELSCTLLIAIVHEETVAAARIGDGWVVAQDHDGVVRAILWPEKGEYFNETVFVSSDRFLERAAFQVEPSNRLSAVAVLSDGLEMVACDLAAQEPLRGFFEPLFAFVRDERSTTDTKRRELERFLRSPRINQKTDDDKTLVVAVCGGGKVREA